MTVTLLRSDDQMEEAIHYSIWEKVFFVWLAQLITYSFGNVTIVNNENCSERKKNEAGSINLKEIVYFVSAL